MDTANKNTTVEEKKPHSVVLAGVCLALQLVSFLFILIATPVDTYRAKSESTRFAGIPTKGRVCYSLWGPKECGAKNVFKMVNGVKLVNRGFPGEQLATVMQVGGVFTILAIAFAVFTIFFSVLMVYGQVPGWNCAAHGMLVLALVIIGVGCSCGGIHVKYTNAAGVKTSLSEDFTLSATPALLIVAMVIQLVYVIVAFFV